VRAPLDNMRRTAGGAGRQRRAFTLIEILTVLFIIGILVALVVGVAGLTRNQAAEEETRTTQKLLLQAIRSYHDDMGSWPASGRTDEGLIETLKTSAAATDVLRNIPTEAYPNDSTGVLDAYANPMTYRRNGALGSGGPLIVSGGPDGRVDTEEDNIRSDKQ